MSNELNSAPEGSTLAKFLAEGMLKHARAYDLGNGITAYVRNASGQVKPFDAIAFDASGAIAAYTGYCKSDFKALEAVRKNLAKRASAK